MASTALRRRPDTSAPSDGSTTILLTDDQPREEGDGSHGAGPSDPSTGVLRLTGGPRSRPRVAWDEAVVDNEGCGRKSTKSKYLLFIVVVFTNLGG